MTDSSALIGRSISHYRVLEKIGEGGMGVVYRARDTRLERDVAVKVLPEGVLGDPAARKRFRNEALALARLNHPNICSVFDFDTDGGSDFLVMELLPGISLHDRLREKKSILEEVPGLGLQLTAGLAAAHDEGVIHRDLKPGNLRVTPDGRLKILDFGLAKFFHPEAGPDATLSAADSSSMSGTVPYMAPEQLRGGVADTRTDIYSAGAVLYEMATGRRPFPERHLARLIDDILNSDPPPASRINPGVSPAMESVLRKALAHRPEDRHQSARELQADLERLSKTQEARPAAKLGMNRIAALVLLCIFAGGAYVGWYMNRKHRLSVPGEAGGSVYSVVVHPASMKTRRSVAVFAIKNVSGRADTAWLSTALSEMLTTELAAGERLRTVPGETVSRAKSDLSLSDADTFAQDTLRRINASIGTDAVVSGSYVVVPGAPDGKIRVDLRVQDSHTGEIISAVSETGTQAELLDVVSRAGAKLRASLGVPELAGDDAGKVRGSLPTTSEAARLYAEGINKLRVNDALAARDILEKAVAADPSNAAIHAALASAWGQLGYDARALEESKKALDLSAGLSRELRLAAEGRYQLAAHNWPKMVEIYQSLFNVFPDNAEYGIQLAIAQSKAGNPQASFAALDELRGTISSVKENPTLDLVEASTADQAADYKRELAAAGRAVERAKSRGERLTAARGLLFSGWALHNLGDNEKATEESLEAKAAYEAAGDRVGLSRALHNLAIILFNQGKLEQAEKYFEQVIAIRRQIQDNQGLSRALGDLGFLYERRGDLAAARKNYEQCLAIAQQISDQGAAAVAYTNLGDIDVAQGKTAEARKSIEQALTIFRQIGNKSGAGACLANLGNMAADAGDSAGARKFYEEATAIFAEIGQKAGTAQLRTLIASLDVEQGDYDAARASYEEALAAAREVGEPSYEGDAESGLSRIGYFQGDWRAARAHAENAVAAAKKSGEKRLMALTDYYFASSLDGEGDMVASEKAVQDGLALARELGDKAVIAIGLEDSADYLFDRGELAAAQRVYEQAITLNKELKAASSVAESRDGLAQVFLESKQTARAAELAKESASEMRRVKNARQEIEAQLILARAALAQGQVSAAQEAVARAATLSAGLHSDSPSRRLALAACTARVTAAAGKTVAARQALQAALDDLGPKSVLSVRFDARLALAEITLTTSGAAAARPLLEAIEKEAGEKNYGLYARKAAALRKS